MVIVTGSKRSGTSMWMQVLASAGLPVIGQAFPGNWETSLKDANPAGFFESRLRRGVFYKTNPDPRTGLYLSPGATRRHAVKVFIPGVVRSDIAYLGRVVATVRPWREVVTSLENLHGLEKAHHQSVASDEADLQQRLARLARTRSPDAPAVEWWRENYELIRDYSIRKYPFTLVSYRRVVESPEAVVPRVLQWLGVDGLNPEAACSAVQPELFRSAPASAEDLPAHWVAVFDAYEEAAYADTTMSAALLRDMNRIHREVEERARPLSRDREVRWEDVDADGA